MRLALEWTATNKAVSIISRVAIVLGLGMSGLATAQQDEGPMSDLRFVVVLHPVNRKGKQTKGGLELKTDNDGNRSSARPCWRVV